VRVQKPPKRTIHIGLRHELWHPQDAGCEVVTDKGYHGGASLAAMQEWGVRTYVSVPQQPRRNGKGKAEQQAAVYANQSRAEGERGKRLLRRRGELLERPFAH
jgi:transposase